MNFFRLISVLIIILVGFLPQKGLAQTENLVEIIPSITHRFGEFISFEATFQSASPVSFVEVVFQLVSDFSSTHSYTAEHDHQSISYQYQITPEKYMPAFSYIQYWFIFHFEDDTTQETPRSIYYYTDNREFYDAGSNAWLPWQSIEGDTFSIYWYKGTKNDAQTLSDIAHNSIAQAQKYINVQPPDHADIYVYDNSSYLKEAIGLSTPSWVGGHTIPESQVILVSLPAGQEQSLEANRLLPHEITHLLLANTYSQGYENIPGWLNEGLASITEFSPDPGLQDYLDEAIENGQVIPLSDICTSFPYDSERAATAYAESTSFVRFLYEERGSKGLTELVTNYASGAGCETGTQAVFNQTLSQLEERWQTQYFQLSMNSSLPDFLPWIGFLLLILIAPVILLISNIRSEG
jgi:hypothetical protein